jgi:hypothetical protein
MLQTSTRKSPRGHCVSGQWKSLQLAPMCHRLRQSHAILGLPAEKFCWNEISRYPPGRSAASVTGNHQKGSDTASSLANGGTRFIPAAFPNG